jgi:single-stranded DNA-binding protein
MAFSHEVYGEKFYETELLVKRLSKKYDKVRIQISESLIDTEKDYRGLFMEVSGQFRSHSRLVGSKHHLDLFVFVHELYVSSIESVYLTPNYIFLDGYICKPSTLRTTPNGRIISDMLLAVNRPTGKSDYIPCICWGRIAQFVSNLNVGSHIQIKGRVQSREYEKRIYDNVNNPESFSVIIKTAYEISVYTVDSFNTAAKKLTTDVLSEPNQSVETGESETKIDQIT